MTIHHLKFILTASQASGLQMITMYKCRLYDCGVILDNALQARGTCIHDNLSREAYTGGQPGVWIINDNILVFAIVYIDVSKTIRKLDRNPVSIILVNDCAYIG